MENLLSDYIGKPVVLLNGSYAGYVTGALLSKKLDALRALVCSDSEEEEFVLPASSIRAFGDGGVMIRSTAGKMPKEMVPAPVGVRVLTENGNLAGIVQDFVREEHKIKQVIFSSGEQYAVSRMRGNGDCLILLREMPSQKNVKREILQEEKDYFQASETLDDQAQETAATETNAKTVQAGSTLLTGKRVPRDVADVRGNIIIRKGSVITPEILKNAIFHNKLFELTITVLNPDS